MAMSKKDYVAVAKVLNKAVVEGRQHKSGLDAGTIASVTADLAEVFAADNPRFDMDRFINASLTGEGI